MTKDYALLGSWRWFDSNDDCGITVCEAGKSGDLKVIKNYFPEVSVGSPVLISKNGYLYFVDETKHTEDRRNEGGYALAAKLNGLEVELVNKIKTYTSNPCYCVFDETEKYLIVVHHGSTRSIAIKLRRDENGKVTNELTYDDAAIELIEINEDGSLGEILDYTMHGPEVKGNKMSLLHQIRPLPGNKGIYIVADKGLDRYYTYKIDYENKKLVLIDDCKVTDFAHPKYVDFYEKEKLIYGVYEKSESCCILKYDESGHLEHIKDFPLQIKEANVCGSVDVMASPRGNKLYLGVSGDNAELRSNDKNNNLYHNKYLPNYVAVYDIEDPLNPVITQFLPSYGTGVRQIQLSIDKSHLLVMNTDNKENGISSFKINNDDSLTYEKNIDAVHPECLTYFEY